MKQWLFLFTVFSFPLLAREEEPRLIPSTPDQVATLSSDANSLIGGIVSPISGQVTLREIDLIAKGAQDIVVDRIYVPLTVSPPSQIPPPENGCQVERCNWYFSHMNFWESVLNEYQGWVYLPHLFVQYDPWRLKILLRDKNGAIYEFQNYGNGFILKNAIYGMSNLVGENPNGTSDPRNIRIKACEDRINVHFPDGITRIYKRSEFAALNLIKEILPNGKIIRYTPQGQQSILIESLDPQERYVYSSLQINGQLNLKPCIDSAQGIDRVSNRYDVQRRALRFKQKKKEYKGNAPDYKPGLTIESSYDCSLPPLLTFSSSPSYRSTIIGYTSWLQLNSFSGKNAVFQCSYGDSPERVKTLSLPVGENDVFADVYKMSYDPAIAGQKGGSTTVEQTDKVKTVYNFSPALLTTSIQTFGPDGKLAKEKIYTWLENQRLEAVELKDGDGNLFYQKRYSQYDDWGNPGLETFTGDLSGEGTQESRTVKREYTKDGKNLLLREETEEGKITLFEYLSGTNLFLSRLILDHEKIILREFWNYDDCNNLVEKIVDDSASKNKDLFDDATQRTITRYRLRQEKPFLHMPEWVDELYWDGSVEKLLTSTKLVYDKRGNIEEKLLYGSDGKLAKTFQYEYDEQGNLLSETNALGQKAFNQYTSKGQLEYSKNFSGRLEKKKDYDLQGRLKNLEEIADCGTHKTKYEYDHFDRCIEEVDYLKNKTTYQLDSLTGKIQQINGPSILSLNGKTEVITSSKYDALGRQLEAIDANKFPTKKSYNAYGSVTEILHPNGSKETNRYYKNGLLKSHIDQEGLKTEYTYDLFGRVLQKIYFSQGKLVADETFTYTSFQPMTHTDREKNTTIYTYDKSGRKTSETESDRVSTFQYDSIGRLASITKNGVTRCLERDNLDRIEEDRQVDVADTILSKIRFGYDVDGNKGTISRYPHNQEQVHTLEYDPFRRIVQEKDPLGHTTTIKYDETKQNSLGQYILTTISTDPKWIETTIQYDPYNREVSREIGSSYSEERTYDPAGNLLQIKEDSLLTRYTYNNQHLIDSLTRAYGTNEARTTSYTYTPGGLLSTKTKPDKTVITYTYDSFGNPKSLTSSDRSIDQVFVYNRNGYLTYASDTLHIVDRIVDRFGNVEQETVDGKLGLAKTYNQHNKVLTIALPDKSWIEYSYNPLNLKTISRHASDGTLFYAHSYDSYDWAGHPLTESLIKNLGILQHTYNPNGQQKTIQSPYFSQALQYDSKGRIVSISGEGSYAYDELSQVTLDRSIFTYDYDRHYNRTQKNGLISDYNSLDELVSLDTVYDLNGNLRQKGEFRFTYDALNRLIQADSKDLHVTFSYDALNRRLSKTSNGSTEFYLYDGSEELGSFESDGRTKDLKVPGLYHNPVALELQGDLFAPILDYRGNIRRVVDVKNAKTVQTFDYTAFGEELSSTPLSGNPWRYSSKRYDSETGLYYFGQRLYDPKTARWISTDPAGFIDGTNLYAYVLNSPLNIQDQDGRFAIPLVGLSWGAGLALTPIGWGAITLGAVATAAVWGYYKLHETGMLKANSGTSSITNGIINAINGTVVLDPYSIFNPSNIFPTVYSPGRPLPVTDDGVPIPETDAPHTELGNREGRKETYPQAREFDANGKPVRDIDFTDHGRPQNHPNPHQHEHKPNPTGGSQIRDPAAQPVTGWNYI